MSELDKNHENWSESGPYGSVWDNILPEWILQGLGSLWDTSRALKPPGKIKIVGIRRLAEIRSIRPYFSGLGRCRVAARPVTLVLSWQSGQLACLLCPALAWSGLGLSCLPCHQQQQRRRNRDPIRDRMLVLDRIPILDRMTILDRIFRDFSWCSCTSLAPP